MKAEKYWAAYLHGKDEPPRLEPTEADAMSYSESAEIFPAYLVPAEEWEALLSVLRKAQQYINVCCHGKLPKVATEIAEILKTRKEATDVQLCACDHAEIERAAIERAAAAEVLREAIDRMYKLSIEPPHTGMRFRAVVDGMLSDMAEELEATDLTGYTPQEVSEIEQQAVGRLLNVAEIERKAKVEVLNELIKRCNSIIGIVDTDVAGNVIIDAIKFRRNALEATDEP